MDRLFGTYRAQPAAGHADMTIGIDLFRRIGDLRLDPAPDWLSRAMSDQSARVLIRFPHSIGAILGGFILLSAAWKVPH